MSTVAAALADMSEWEDVATELYVRGIVGVPGQAMSCPVASYLAPFGECAVVSGWYSPNREVLSDGEVSEFPSNGGSEVLHQLPENVNQFVIDFDRDRYPELDARNVEN